MIQTELDFAQSGKSLAAHANLGNLRLAQNVAKLIAKDMESITVDEVRQALPEIEFKSGWTGSIFAGECWEFIGFAAATHARSHGHLIRRWKLKK